MDLHLIYSPEKLDKLFLSSKTFFFFFCEISFLTINFSLFAYGMYVSHKILFLLLDCMTETFETREQGIGNKTVSNANIQMNSYYIR